MKEKLINLSELWNLRNTYPILDARSEGEFLQSHLPGSINIPILNDQERKFIGTIYKQEGSEKAILKGFEIVGPRFHSIQSQALKQFPDKKLILYCWRGGMRSQILSWLLGMVGFDVFRLNGGYKTYRSYTYEAVRKPYNLLVIGGKTGSGKTQLLHALANKGEQIIDLEGLASHKGSAFGGIGQAPQPSTEQFENLLAEELIKCSFSESIWIENESRNIGSVKLPDELFMNMRASPLIDISKSLEERTQLIKEEYAFLPKEELFKAVEKLKNKLGGLRTQEALEDIANDRHSLWIQNLLIYYDKAYDFDMEKRQVHNNYHLPLTGETISNSCTKLIEEKIKIRNGYSGNQTYPME